MQYKNVTSDADIAYLESHPRWVKANRHCPTCEKPVPCYENTYFFWNGTNNICAKDEDYICLQYKLFTLYERANIPFKYQRLNFTDDFVLQPKAKEHIEAYIDALDIAIDNGIGLYIYSQGLGTGKTFMACHILKEAVKSGYDCFYIPFHELVGFYNLEPELRKYVEVKLLESDVLVIDDVILGATSDKQATHFSTILEHVVRHRVHNSLPVIVTTNLTPDEIKNSYGRIFSLMKEGAYEIELGSNLDARIEFGVNAINRALLRRERPPIV